MKKALTPRPKPVGVIPTSRDICCPAKLTFIRSMELMNVSTAMGSSRHTVLRYRGSVTRASESGARGGAVDHDALTRDVSRVLAAKHSHQRADVAGITEAPGRNLVGLDELRDLDIVSGAIALCSGGELVVHRCRVEHARQHGVEGHIVRRHAPCDGTGVVHQRGPGCATENAQLERILGCD